MQIKEKIKKIKKYGLLKSILKIVWKVFNSLGIYYEKYLIYRVKISALPDLGLKLPRGYDIKEIGLNDYLNSEILSFSENKMKKIIHRYNVGSYKSYGIFKDDDLIFSGWISYEHSEMPSHLPLIDQVRKNEGYLFDAFCHPDHRNTGLHKYMILYRFNEIQKVGRTHATTIVAKDNIPSRRSCEKVGFEEEKLVSIIKIGRYVMIREKLIDEFRKKSQI
jgi:hypothetical protein